MFWLFSKMVLMMIWWPVDADDNGDHVVNYDTERYVTWGDVLGCLTWGRVSRGVASQLNTTALKSNHWPGTAKPSTSASEYFSWFSVSSSSATPCGVVRDDWRTSNNERDVSFHFVRQRDQHLKEALCFCFSCFWLYMLDLAFWLTILSLCHNPTIPWSWALHGRITSISNITTLTTLILMALVGCTKARRFLGKLKKRTWHW